MLQPATYPPHAGCSRSGPREFIQPPIPYAFAFALKNSTALDTRLPLEKVVTIAVTNGTRAPHPPHDLFAARVPVIPAVTGPLCLVGVRPGDILEVEVLAIQPDGPGSIDSHLVTIAVATGRAEQDADPAQSAIPAGGAVRVTAGQPGGLISFGPVVPRRQRAGDSRGEPVAARVTVRCTLMTSQGG
jgi:hypothetical protein